jgi:hypothetical protein
MIDGKVMRMKLAIAIEMTRFFMVEYLREGWRECNIGIAIDPLLTRRI